MLSVSIVSQDTTAGVSLDFCCLGGLVLDFLMWTYGELVTLSSKGHSYVRSVFTGTYHQMSRRRINLVMSSDDTTSKQGLHMTLFPLTPKPACRLTNFSIELSQSLSNVTEKNSSISRGCLTAHATHYACSRLCGHTPTG